MSVRTFNDMLQLVGEAATSLVYTRNIYDDHDGKIQAGQQRSLPATDELLMTLVKLDTTFDVFMPESFTSKYPSTRVVIDATEFFFY